MACIVNAFAVSTKLSSIDLWPCRAHQNVPNLPRAVHHIWFQHGRRVQQMPNERLNHQVFLATAERPTCPLCLRQACSAIDLAVLEGQPGYRKKLKALAKCIKNCYMILGRFESLCQASSIDENSFFNSARQRPSSDRSGRRSQRTFFNSKGDLRMDEKVRIYGKAGWPYTTRAREAHKEHDYFDVKADNQMMDAMLKLAGGQRKVPVIVEGEKVTIGFGGTWGVWYLGPGGPTSQPFILYFQVIFSVKLSSVDPLWHGRYGIMFNACGCCIDLLFRYAHYIQPYLSKWIKTFYQQRVAKKTVPKAARRGDANSQLYPIHTCH